MVLIIIYKIHSYRNSSNWFLYDGDTAALLPLLEDYVLLGIWLAKPKTKINLTTFSCSLLTKGLYYAVWSFIPPPTFEYLWKMRFKEFYPHFLPSSTTIVFWIMYSPLALLSFYCEITIRYKMQTHFGDQFF